MSATAETAKGNIKLPLNELEPEHLAHYVQTVFVCERFLCERTAFKTPVAIFPKLTHKCTTAYSMQDSSALNLCAARLQSHTLRLSIKRTVCTDWLVSLKAEVKGGG